MKLHLQTLFYFRNLTSHPTSRQKRWSIHKAPFNEAYFYVPISLQNFSAKHSFRTLPHIKMHEHPYNFYCMLHNCQLNSLCYADLFLLQTIISTREIHSVPFCHEASWHPLNLYAYFHWIIKTRRNADSVEYCYGMKEPEKSFKEGTKVGKWKMLLRVFPILA